MKILIVDDSRSMRQIVRLSLSEIPGCEIIEAVDGVEAETNLQEAELLGKPFDIVILDWMMPNFNGYQLLKSIRTTDSFKDRPIVIMLTAETYPEQIEACLKYNVASYILKPFTKEILLAAVNKAVAERDQKHAV